MGTNPDDQELLRRAVAKRGPSAAGWAWKRQPTAEERKVFNYFKRHGAIFCDETQALDIAEHYGYPDTFGVEIIGAVERAYPPIQKGGNH